MLKQYLIIIIIIYVTCRKFAAVESSIKNWVSNFCVSGSLASSFNGCYSLPLRLAYFFCKYLLTDRLSKTAIETSATSTFIHHTLIGSKWIQILHPVKHLDDTS
jgi:hypothetical protein